MIITKFQRT